MALNWYIKYTLSDLADMSLDDSLYIAPELLGAGDYRISAAFHNGLRAMRSSPWRLRYIQLQIEVEHTESRVCRVGLRFVAGKPVCGNCKVGAPINITDSKDYFSICAYLLNIDIACLSVCCRPVQKSRKEGISMPELPTVPRSPEILPGHHVRRRRSSYGISNK